MKLGRSNPGSRAAGETSGAAASPPQIGQRAAGDTVGVTGPSPTSGSPSSRAGRSEQFHASSLLHLMARVFMRDPEHLFGEVLAFGRKERG